MCLNHDLYFFWLSSLAYPNLLGKKSYVVVVVNMKRKKSSSAITDLRSFLQKSAAKKKQTEPEIVTPSTNESQMQLVVFQRQRDIGTSIGQPQSVINEQWQPVEPPITEEGRTA